MSGTFKIIAVGDISMGDHPVCAGHGMRSTFQKRKSEVLKGVETHLKQSDITLANLETVASNVGLNRFWLPSFEMRGDPGSLKYIREAGVDLVGVANNHSMQHGEAAFSDSVEHVRKEGLEIIGLDQEPGRTQPYVYSKDGVEHTFFSVSLRPEEWHAGPVPYSIRDDEKKLIAEVEVLRRECKGFLICSIHWGLEFLDYPSPEQKRVGRALIDAGVDVVFGHHSHILQPVERYKDGLIFYSLGNFVFDMWRPENKLSVIAQVNLSKGEAPSYSLIPVVIGDDLLLRVANDIESETILAKMHPDREELGYEISAEDYAKRCGEIQKKARFIKYAYFIKNFYKYSPPFFVQSLLRTFLRRLSGN